MTLDPRSARGSRSMIATAIVLASVQTAIADGARIPWTTSRLAGTPDPAPPYKVEPAFPRLSLESPVLLDFVPGTNRLVVAELTGKARSFLNDPKADRAEVALDLPAARPGAGPIYGLAFHPGFETNRYVYVCYVAKGDAPDGTRVSRFTASAVDPLTIDAATEEIVLTFLSGGHNAGCLAFGPDGCLYIATGDSAAPTPPDPLKTGQDVSDLLSSILRVDVDHRDAGKTYRVPADNPFVALPGARPEVWAYGLRNPWRMSFDRERGDLWVGDVGWELWEMIHLVRKGSNCGWSIVEGYQPVRSEAKLGPTPIIPPVVVHPHSEAASITGGYVYRGKRLPALRGVYIYGDYQSGKVWGLRHDGKSVTWHGELADTGLRLVSFGEDRAGELYLIELERTNGIYQLAPDPSAGARSAFPRRLSETGLFASTASHEPAPGVVPYAINAELWADGARAERLMAIPGEGRAEVDDQGRWRLPDGSVLARTVTLDLIEGDPKSRRRLETQVLHREAGSWRPYTYVWDDAQTDAMLADASGASRSFSVRDPAAPGGTREPTHRFAARSECVLCHNPWVESGTTSFGRQSASPLGLTTAQLNRGDQLARLVALGLVSRALTAADSPRLADPRDRSAPIEARARAYLQANCAHCHQEGAGGTANLILTARTALAQTRALNALPAQGGFGIDDARLIVPGEPERSVLFYRMAKTGPGRMPRIGSERVDAEGLRVVGDWIAGLPRAAPARPATDEGKAIGPVSREAISRPLGSTTEALGLLRRIEAGQLSESSRREVIEAARSTRPEVRELFERFLPESERSKRLGDAIDPAALLALPGDAMRGRALFRVEGGVSCRTCHKAEGVGVEIGPPLDEIGSKYAKADLLTHVLDPSRLVEPKYAVHAIATRGGQTHLGIPVEESAREVVLRDATGRTTRVAVAEIDERRREPKSLMPEGLLRDLTARQAADLIAYLASLKKP